MEKPKEAQSLEYYFRRYLEDNPDLREALDVFNLSQQTYLSILAATAPITKTTSSTNSN